MPNPEALIRETQAFADKVFRTVSTEYLEFRRTYYGEAQPDLNTSPPSHNQIHKAEAAYVAESVLRMVPQVVKTIPLLGSFLQHLEQVANLNSISERERTALHHISMRYLHGIDGGIQPWLAEWLGSAARQLSHVDTASYFMSYPWEALLYMPPAALATYARAVEHGDIAAIVAVVGALGKRLADVLRDPIAAQARLAFTGPEGERRKKVFHLKTGVALALGAYLVADEIHVLLRPHEVGASPESVLTPPQP
jgi:hypothetical protein